MHCAQCHGVVFWSEDEEPLHEAGGVDHEVLALVECSGCESTEFHRCETGDPGCLHCDHCPRIVEPVRLPEVQP